MDTNKVSNLFKYKDLEVFKQFFLLDSIQYAVYTYMHEHYSITYKLYCSPVESSTSLTVLLQCYIQCYKLVSSMSSKYCSCVHSDMACDHVSRVPG